MIILDTNVLSELMQTRPEGKVVAWLDAKPQNSIWTTSITILEIRYGLQIMPAGKRRSALMIAFESVLDKIVDQTAAFDVAAAQMAGDLMALRQSKGHSGDLRDTMIAGIVLAQHATLATRNTVRFEDVPIPLVNPWVG
jgi:predicted nucleic acid-binding protein